MRFSFYIRDQHGWPVMSVDQLVSEAKDGLRVQNYAIQRFNDFKRMCGMHRNVTNEARIAVAKKQQVKQHSIGSLFRQLFQYQDNERIKELEAEIIGLKKRIRELEPPIEGQIGY